MTAFLGRVSWSDLISELETIKFQSGQEENVILFVNWINCSSATPFVGSSSSSHKPLQPRAFQPLLGLHSCHLCHDYRWETISQHDNPFTSPYRVWSSIVIVHEKSVLKYLKNGWNYFDKKYWTKPWHFGLQKSPNKWTPKKLNFSK